MFRKLRGLSAIIVMLFGASLVWAAYNVNEGDRLLHGRVVENVEWAGWQVPFELGRLENALLLFAREPSEEHRVRALTRLDIVASRIAILKQGRVRQELVEFGLADELRPLTEQFHLLDQRTQSFLVVNENTYPAQAIQIAEQAFELLRGFQHFAAKIQVAETQRISSIIGSKEDHLRRVQISIVGLLVSGVLVGGYMLASNRRARRLSEVSQQAREQVELSKSILHDAITALPDGFALFDRDDRLLLFNEHYREYYQTSADLIFVGATFEDIIRKGVERGQYREAQEDPEGWIARRMAKHRNPSGTSEQWLNDGRVVRVHELRTNAGYTVGIRTDITDIRHAQALAEQSEQRFRLASLATMDGLWEWNASTGEFWFSMTFREILGLDDVLAPSVPWECLVTSESWQRTQEALQRCSEGLSERMKVEQIVEREGQKPKYIECRGIRETDDEGRTIRIVGAVSDITRRRQVEESLRDARAAAIQVAETRTRFMAMTSHEIRTPINGVMGALEVISESELAPEARRYVEIASDAVQSLRAIIDDVLDMAKIDAGEFVLRMGSFSPGQMVREVAELMSVRARQNDLDLCVFLDPELPSNLISDPARLRQVVINLVGNAVKFTNEGAIALSVEHEMADDGLCRLKFTVTDTGIGIAPDVVNRVFEPFRQLDEGYRREFGGTGLGLSISRSIVEALGGRIACESEPGVGSSFHFEVPCQMGSDRTPIYDRDAFQGLRFAIDVKSDTVADNLERQITALSGEVIDVRAPYGNDGSRIDVILTQRSGQAIAAEQGFHAAKVIVLGSADFPAPYEIGHLLQLVFEGRLDRRGIQREDKSRATMNLAGKRVLVADDSDINRQLAERMLVAAGLSAHCVENGAEAVEAARDEPFDIIMMDISMPVMDGLEATREIREFSDVPIIGVTAHAFASVTEELSRAGMSAHLVKPYRQSELLELLAEHLKESEDPGVSMVLSPPAQPVACEGLMPERILDMATLNDLFGDVGDETLIDLIHAFLDEMDERVDRLTQGISTLDNDLVKHEAHALKSSAKAFGALKLSSIARRLEAAGSLGEVGQIDDQDRQIKQVAVATRAEFEAKVLHAQPLDLS